MADPGVVLGAVVAAAAIAGSLSLNRKMILRVPKKLGDEDEEVTRLPGRQGMLPSAQYDPHVFFSRKDTNATANWGAGPEPDRLYPNKG